MSAQNRSAYNLRPRSKVVKFNPKPIPEKISLTRREKARRQKIIDEQAKLPHSEIEGAGERFFTLKGEELDKYIRAKIGSLGLVHTPPIRLSDEERARIHAKQALSLADTGLSFLNQSSSSTGAEYELVATRAGRFFLSSRGGVHHFNFEAKLKNDPVAKPQLFFLEIVEKSPGAKKLTHCRSLGLAGSKAAATGRNGCRACSKVNHPKGVRFVTC